MNYWTPFGLLYQPTPPVEQTFKRMGMVRLDCTLSLVDRGSDFVDFIIMEVVPNDDMELISAMQFVWYYNDGTSSMCLPASVVYKNNHYTLSVTGYKIATYVDPDKINSCGSLMYFKKGVLK